MPVVPCRTRGGRELEHWSPNDAARASHVCEVRAASLDSMLQLPFLLLFYMEQPAYSYSLLIREAVLCLSESGTRMPRV